MAIFAVLTQPQQVNFNINTWSYLITDFDYSNPYFNNYRTNWWVKYKLSPTHQYYLTRSTNKSTSWYKLVTMVVSYWKKWKEVFLYINWIKQNNDSEDPIWAYKVSNPFQEDKFLNYKFYIWDRKNYNWYTNKLWFLWDIDEVKVYNRALSDDEVLQQAKSVGL